MSVGNGDAICGTAEAAAKNIADGLELSYAYKK